MSMSPIVSEKEAARYLSVSRRTLQDWRVKGSGPAYTKLGHRVGYLKSSLDEFVDANRVNPKRLRPGGGRSA